MRQAKTDLAEQIFLATDRLMAKEGLDRLSMHKIAKEANVAAGTIYLYFKNKDELLEQFAHRVFSMFMATLEKDFDESKPFFEQYRQMWKNIWYFLQENPTILSNLKQYESCLISRIFVKTLKIVVGIYFVTKPKKLAY